MVCYNFTTITHFTHKPEIINHVPDDRSAGYQRVGDVMAHVASKCGVEVDDTTLIRWRQAMGLLREFDTFADEDCAEPSDALAALKDFSLFAPRYPSLNPEVLGSVTFDEVLENVQIILDIGGLMERETDIDALIELRKAEAYYTAMALGAMATPHVRQQENFDTCMWRFIGLGIGANLADSILDARRDYARGKSELEPTMVLYRRLGKDALHHAKPHAHTVLDAKGLKLRSQMIGHRIVHRLRHGITPHSNLHLIESLWRRHPRKI